MSTARSTWVDVLLTAIAPMTWGTTFIVTTHLLPPDEPFTAAWMRALPAGLLALLIGRRLPKGRWWWRALVLGTLNIGAFFPLLFIGAERLPGGVAAVLGAIGPLVVALLSRPLLGRVPTVAQIAWGVVAVFGVGLITINGGEAKFDTFGLVAGLVGAAFMATGTVLGNRWGRPVDVVSFAGWQLTTGGLVIVPFALPLEGVPNDFSAKPVAGYLWMVIVGGLVSYVLWFRGTAMIPAGQVAFMQLLSPVVAVLIGWFVVGEVLTLRQWVGFVITLGAIVAAGRAAARAGRIRPQVEEAPRPLSGALTND